MQEKNGWEDKEEEKWIFDQKESQKNVDNTVKYIKYFTLFFILLTTVIYFFAVKFL